jgi:hypothetical protein
MMRQRGWPLCLVLIVTSALADSPQSAGSGSLQQLTGVYELIGDDEWIAGARHNLGSPDRIEFKPGARVSVDGRAANIDPLRLCAPIGPFRMMAQPKLRLELVVASDRVVLLFEDVLHGYLRNLYLSRAHRPDYVPGYAFQGDSVAHWSAGTLQVDTIGFNERTWLNDHVKADAGLHLLESFEPIERGRFLAYRMTASDPGVMTQAYTYVRYLRRVETPITEMECHIDSPWTPGND